MRTSITVLALMLALVAVPAAAQVEEEPVSEPCTADQVEAADFVLTPDGLTQTVATPQTPSPYPLGLGGEPDPLGFQAMATEIHTILLDVSPDFVSATADVRLAWEHTGDIDLDVYHDGQLRGESHQFNPEVGNTEAASAGRIGHCETLEVHIRNYIATPGDITMTLTPASFRDQ